MPDKPKILAVKLSSLGDLFHALPAVAAVQEAMDAEIYWVTQPEYARLVECFDPVHKAISFPRRAWMREGKYFVRTLRQQSYDAVLDFQGLLKSGLVCRLAKSNLRIAPPTIREVPASWYSRVASRATTGSHAVDQSMSVAKELGVSVEKVQFPVTFPSYDFGEQDLPLVGVAPCSRWPSKNWPEQHLIEALNNIQQSRPCRAVLIGAPDDRPICQRIAEALQGPVTNLAGDCSLVELGGLIQGLDCLITNDSGPMHMAVATNTPLVALFGPTDPQRTGPYGRLHQVLQPEATLLEGVTHRDYKRLDDALIASIPVEAVVEQTLSHIAS